MSHVIQISQTKFDELLNRISRLETMVAKLLERDAVSREEEPSEYMIEQLRLSEEDEKAGRFISFKSGKEALEYLDKEILHDKQKRATR